MHDTKFVVPLLKTCVNQCLLCRTNLVCFFLLSALFPKALKVTGDLLNNLEIASLLFSFFSARLFYEKIDEYHIFFLAKDKMTP